MKFDFKEKDSCGVGFIASRGLPPTHGMTLKILELEILKRKMMLDSMEKMLGNKLV